MNVPGDKVETKEIVPGRLTALVPTPYWRGKWMIGRTDKRRRFVIHSEAPTLEAAIERGKRLADHNLGKT